MLKSYHREMLARVFTKQKSIMTGSLLLHSEHREVLLNSLRARNPLEWSYRTTLLLDALAYELHIGCTLI